MKGPTDKLFGHHAFDFDHDGKIDANEWAFINDYLFNEQDTSLSNCEKDRLEIAGLDREYLKSMDGDVVQDLNCFDNEI